MFAFGQSSARFAIKQSKMLLLQISIIVGGASIVSGSNWKSDLTNCDLRGFCQGNLLNEEPEIDWEYLCLDLCKTTEDCKWYSYDMETKICSLFETCPTLDEDCIHCISGERGCPLSKPKLLVATGYPYNPSRKSEVIDIDNPNVSCQSLPDLPVQDVSAAGGLVSGNIPLICGGTVIGLGGETDRCAILNNFGRWIEIGQMLEAKEEAASMLWNHTTLLVTGGQHGPDNYLSTTELITVKQSQSQSEDNQPQYSFSTRSAPNLPINVSLHCIVRLNESTAFLIGGWNGKGETYFLDLTTDLDAEMFAFTRGPQLAIGRYFHVCGVLSNPGDGNETVVVMTGGSNNGHHRTTEMWIPGSNEWIKGPDLPEAVSYTSGLTSADRKSLLVVGGIVRTGIESNEVSTIYQLSFQDGSWQWTKLEQELQVPRSFHLTMLMPNSLATCTLN